MEKISHIVSKINIWITAVIIVLIPLFFLPFTSNFYAFNKQALLFVGVALLLIIWGINIGITAKITVLKPRFIIPLLLLAAAFLLSTFLVSNNRVEALLLPENTGSMIALVIFYYLLASQLTEPTKRRLIIFSLVILSALLSLIAIYQYVGLSKQLTSLSWLNNKYWTPTGAPIILFSLLVIIFPISLINFIRQLNRSLISAAAFGLSAVLSFITIILIGLNLLPGKEAATITLSYLSAWAIAVEAFKQSPLLGVGPENFLSAFNRFRPVGFNQNPLWDVRFSVSSSYILQLLTTVGALGLAAFVWLVAKIIPQTKTSFREPVFIALVINLLSLIFLPGNLMTLFTLIVLLALLSEDKEIKSITLPRQISWLPVFLLGIIIIPLFYLLGKIYLGEVNYKLSLDAINRNDATAVYNYQVKAISYNPYFSNYRIAYSQTNLAIASGLTNNPNLTDQDRNNISQLIQQSIREAKAATALNPTNSVAWENLAIIYRNLIGIAEGADQWTLAAYQQAINMDPISPRLRLNLGGLFYGLGNYDLAVRQFQDSINLKTDYANGYYNLAATYNQQQKYAEAYQALQLVLNYIPIDSEDYKRAKSELDELAKRLPSPTPTPSPAAGTTTNQLTEPQPLPSPIIEPPIQLPEESGTTPPAPSPTPSPVVTP